ncbi:MAG: hypothetical protein GX086_12795 [Alcaligenaceae bacterium]|nr:hypothetical protein [Alcaligenaceae bacterium]
MIEIWQEVNCPQHDYDIFGDDMVHYGQKFRCLACGDEHVAVPGLVATYIQIGSVMGFPDLPATPEALDLLRQGCSY